MASPYAGQIAKNMDLATKMTAVKPAVAKPKPPPVITDTIGKVQPLAPIASQFPNPNKTITPQAIDWGVPAGGNPADPGPQVPAAWTAGPNPLTYTPPTAPPAAATWDFSPPPAVEAQGGGASGGGTGAALPTDPFGSAIRAIQVGKDFTPDYNALIHGDPAYLAYMNSEQGALSNAATSRAAAIKAAAIRYGGGLPAGTTDAYGDLSPDISALAGENQYSDLANIDRSYKQGTESFKRALAARGALHSGDLNYGLDQLNNTQGQQQYDAGQNFAGAFNSAIQNYLGTVNSQKQGEAGAISQAEQSVYANPANRPTTASSANLVPNWSSLYGTPVYQGIDGALYHADGSTY